MIEARVQDIRFYTFRRGEDLFLDANVWLCINGPTTPSPRTSTVAYSKALRDIRLSGGTIFIDVLVLSEFINRYARLEYGQTCTDGRDFKQFRDSAEFGSIAHQISIAAKRVVTQCQRTESGFVPIDIVSLLVEYEQKRHDFNDQMIAETCRAKNLKLVTHDFDFRNFGLDILTANRQLIEAC
jgi:predicted nucleic acid-binding protein